MNASACHISPFAGQWYPEDPSELRDLLGAIFRKSEERTGRCLLPRPLGFVVPHAGLTYSGTVAGAAYRHLRASRPPLAVVIGFTHRGGPRGCWIPDIAAYRTPLGDTPLDRAAVDLLTAAGPFLRVAEASLCDHSVELQLPLLLEASPETRVLPVYVSRLDPAQRRMAAEALAELVRQGAVLIASSDLTHYGRSFGYMPFPADSWTGERLREMDESTMEAMGSLRPKLFQEALTASGSTVCGVEPISLLLETLQLLETPEDEVFQQNLDYQTSGELTGDFQHSVSYGALGYFSHRSMELPAEDQQLLLDSVRKTLCTYLETGQRRSIPPERITPALEWRSTAFVTLHENGKLRGCVGRRSTREPLYRIVPELALSAALDDSRFEPVAPGEQGLEWEISVLTPMKRLQDAGEFRVGAHGALLEAGSHQALLLPQVATERNWNSEQFLDALARKAGASRSVYAGRNTKLFAFRAQIIQ